MKEKIEIKLEEHIMELLQKPTISNEDYALLKQKLAEFPAEKSNGFDLMLLLLLMMISSGWGGSAK